MDWTFYYPAADVFVLSSIIKDHSSQEIQSRVSKVHFFLKKGDFEVHGKWIKAEKLRVANNCTNVGGNNESIINGVNGFLVCYRTGFSQDLRLAKYLSLHG